jgi:hypothetical protein
MVDREVCRKCLWYYERAPKRDGGPIRFKKIWRCIKDSIHVPSKKLVWIEKAKVLWEEENPIKGCPYLLQHALACAAKLRKII